MGTMRCFAVALVTALVVPATVGAAPLATKFTMMQDTARTDSVFPLAAITVTATRSPRAVFRTPAPVAVVGRQAIRSQLPNTVTDLFRTIPGMDVTGVGVQQPRPMIRGQRGQRILLLEDGLRLNNSRRQQDFGEIPGLVDVERVERVEVVRGPASVLYGTDAIGGVINIITRTPMRDGVHGSASYLYGDAAQQHRGAVDVFGRAGAWDFQIGGSARDASSYRAPAGTFGDIVLAEEGVVHDSGVKERSGDTRVAYRIASNHSVFARMEAYSAEDAGFGYVDPDAYAPDQPRIRITYPDQRLWKTSAGYAGDHLGLAIADAVDFAAYIQDNERHLDFDLFQSFGPQAPPGAGVSVQTENFSDLRTTGFRLEARKQAGRVLLTYGADLFRDASENTDSSMTTVSGFGPPQTEVSLRPQVPNATFRSTGVFLQGELTLGRATLIAGGRVQDIHAATRATDGLDDALVSKTDRTVVGAANALYALTDHIVLVASVGRAFRSPNLIEWFFEGPTPEGNGFQLRSPELQAETSLNVDLGARYGDRRLSLEGFVFRNEIRDGIRIASADTTIDGLPGFRNVNVDELLYRGIELSGDLAIAHGFGINGGFARLDSENTLDPSNPVGESFSTKVTGGVRYEDPRGRFSARWWIRHQGEQKDVDLGTNPVGDVLPAFTVHSAGAAVTLFAGTGHEQRLVLTVHNLADVLYSETSNASFFRPEPGRRATLSWQTRF